MLIALLNVPRTREQWDWWSYNHRLSHDRIRSALANLTGIESVTVTNGGSGYTSFPTVSFLGGGGTGVTYEVQLTAGAVTAIIIVNPGKDFTAVPQVVITGGGGLGAAATAVRGPGIATTDYQLDPIAENDLPGWLQRNSQTHIEMDAALGVQGVDLQDVDLSDENQKQAWFWLHFLEHQSAENTLGIGS